MIRLRNQGGFTLLEILVAAVLLVILGVALGIGLGIITINDDEKLVGVDPTELCQDQVEGRNIVAAADPGKQSPWHCGRFTLTHIPDIQGYCEKITRSADVEIVVKDTGVHCKS